MILGVKCETCAFMRAFHPEPNGDTPTAVLAHISLQENHRLIWPVEVPDDTPEVDMNELAAAQGYRRGWAAASASWRAKVGAAVAELLK